MSENLLLVVISSRTIKPRIVCIRKRGRVWNVCLQTWEDHLHNALITLQGTHRNKKHFMRNLESIALDPPKWQGLNATDTFSWEDKDLLKNRTGYRSKIVIRAAQWREKFNKKSRRGRGSAVVNTIAITFWSLIVCFLPTREHAMIVKLLIFTPVLSSSLMKELTSTLSLPYTQLVSFGTITLIHLSPLQQLIHLKCKVGCDFGLL